MDMLDYCKVQILPRAAKAAETVSALPDPGLQLSEDEIRVEPNLWGPWMWSPVGKAQGQEAFVPHAGQECPPPAQSEQRWNKAEEAGQPVVTLPLLPKLTLCLMEGWVTDPGGSD